MGKITAQGSPDQKIVQEILPSTILNTSMNYIAHLLLMGFLASSGLKVASIGAQLIRPIKIKVDEEKKIL